MDHQNKGLRNIHVLPPSHVDYACKHLHTDGRYERGPNIILSCVQQYDRGDIETEQPSGGSKECQPREAKDAGGNETQALSELRRCQRCDPMTLS